LTVSVEVKYFMHCTECL